MQLARGRPGVSGARYSNTCTTDSLDGRIRLQTRWLGENSCTVADQPQWWCAVGSSLAVPRRLLSVRIQKKLIVFGHRAGRGNLVMQVIQLRQPEGHATHCLANAVPESTYVSPCLCGDRQYATKGEISTEPLQVSTAPPKLSCSERISTLATLIRGRQAAIVALRAAPGCLARSRGFRDNSRLSACPERSGGWPTPLADPENVTDALSS